MTHYDVFNGDADGLCALHQLRLAAPLDAVLVSGVKRDVALLARVRAEPGDSITVLDVSLAANRSALLNLLEREVRVEYFDHHFAGELPAHPNLIATIDPSPAICTGLIVDRHLRGSHRIWAVVAAFGDNLAGPAREAASTLGLSTRQLEELRALGDVLAYNAYADVESDLIVHPTTLYLLLSRYADPFEFMRAEPVYAQICERRRDDLRMAELVEPELTLPGATIYILPDEQWSRRVRGSFANDRANRFPDVAHAVLTRNGQHGYTVSVRTPLAKGTGADALCRKFPTGGGRAAAAGINHLPEEHLPEFVREIDRAFS
jgi:hypothetical protein